MLIRGFLSAGFVYIIYFWIRGNYNWHWACFNLFKVAYFGICF